MFSFVVYLRLLLVIFIGSTNAFDSSIYPESPSFHHVLQWIQRHAHWTNESSVTLSTLLPSIINGTTCANDLFHLIESLSKGEKWALKVLDAWGTKPPAGILEGSHLWLGSYDECRHPLYLPLNRTYALQPYPTKYCTAAHWTGSEDEDIVVFQKPLLIVGLCLPESCKDEDFQSNFFSVRCASDHRSMSIGTILTICLLLFLVLFINLAGWIPPLREYSARFTLTRLFSLRHSTNDDYRFLNGIRIFSLLWIILGHSFVFQLSIADNIVHILDVIQNSLLMRLLFGAIFAVDTFFFISGFLFVLVFLHKFQTFEKFRFIDILFYYLHRYCRLIPTLAFILLLSIHLSPWLGHGPLFPTKTGFELPACHQQWWKTILFVNNLIDPTRSCLAVTWYLANDFQFHLLAPFLLIPWLINRRRLTYFLLSFFLLVHILTVMIIVLMNPGLETGFEKDDGPSLDFFEKIYVTPWCRIGPFLIGMITKLILEDYSCVLSTLKKIFGTTVAIILALLCMFLPFYSDSLPRWSLILYQSMSRPCWSISIAWIIILCATRQVPRLNNFLSWPIWTILARLSYSAYLIHATIILTEVYNRYSVLHYQVEVIFSGFLGQTFITFLGSVCVILLVESPCSTLTKKIRHYLKTKPLPIQVNQSTYGTIG